jgi:hypothetical protein
MVVCLDLSVRMRSQRGGLTEGRDYQELAGREYRALQTSQRIWTINSAASPEAHIAALALGLMIKKVAENDVGIFPVHDNLSKDTYPIVDFELPYADAMSQMIDGSGSIDWVSSRGPPQTWRLAF